MLKTVITDLGVEPNSANRVGTTMMLAACRGGNTRILKALAELGADINQADHNGIVHRTII